MIFRSPQRTVEKVLEECRQALRRSHPELVESVTWYGAVEIDRKHLVVWVLLNGPAAELPVWYFPSGDPAKDAADAGALTGTLAEIQRFVRGVFAEHGWPAAETVRVGFDSQERVREGGGWHYFK